MTLGISGCGDVGNSSARKVPALMYCTIGTPGIIADGTAGTKDGAFARGWRHGQNVWALLEGTRLIMGGNSLWNVAWCSGRGIWDASPSD